MRKLFFLIMFCTQTAHSFSWHHQIVDVKSKTFIDFSDLARFTQGYEYIAIGEKHNTKEVQELESRIIEELVQKDGNYVLAWEFLAHTESEKNNILFEDFLAGKINSYEFLTSTIGQGSAEFYVPVMETIKNLGIPLIGLNLTRAEKAPVTKGGIKSADPLLVPPGFELGGDFYFERFKEAMGEHVPAEKLANYYDAQCLTDDVMAYTLLQQPKDKTYFIIAGSFHTDYLDATLARIKIRAPAVKLLSIKIIDAADYKEAELLELLHHEKYGPISNYVIYVNEPQPN